MPKKKTLEEKISDLEREEESKVNWRWQSKYNERLYKWADKAERKANELERKIRLTYKKKREKLLRVSKWMQEKPNRVLRDEEKKKKMRKAKKLFSYSVRISRATFNKDVRWFYTSCETCDDVYMVCRWDIEKKKRQRFADIQNGHQIQQWRWNWLRFYRPVCRPQCKGCNIYKSTEQKEWEKNRANNHTEEEYQKALQEKWPKKISIEDLDQVIEESQKIIDEKIDIAKKWIS